MLTPSPIPNWVGWNHLDAVATDKHWIATHLAPQKENFVELTFEAMDNPSMPHEAVIDVLLQLWALFVFSKSEERGSHVQAIRILPKFSPGRFYHSEVLAHGQMEVPPRQLMIPDGFFYTEDPLFPSVMVEVGMSQSSIDLALKAYNWHKELPWVCVWTVGIKRTGKDEFTFVFRLWTPELLKAAGEDFDAYSEDKTDSAARKKVEEHFMKPFARFPSGVSKGPSMPFKIELWPMFKIATKTYKATEADAKTAVKRLSYEWQVDEDCFNELFWTMVKHKYNVHEGRNQSEPNKASISKTQSGTKSSTRHYTTSPAQGPEIFHPPYHMAHEPTTAPELDFQDSSGHLESSLVTRHETRA